LTVWISRLLLGICAAAAIVGGGALVVMVIAYFAADTYLHQLQQGGNGILAGMLGLAIYVGGAFRAHLVGRIATGIGVALASALLTVALASLVSLLGDPGGERGNLEDGTAGGIWFLMGAYFVWQLSTRRWPVSQKRAAAPTGEPSPAPSHSSQDV
jgi:hypothetical protein